MVWHCAIAMSWLVALSQPAAAHEPSQPDELPLGQRTFRRFGAADGLRNLVIASMTQDASGFLWLGTEDGVYRFDGERLTRFSDEAYVVGVGPEGNACLGYRTGLRCWTGSGFSRVSVGGMPEIPVRTMASFGGRLWVGSDAGLYVGAASDGFAPAPGWKSTAAVGALWADAAGLVAGDGASLRLSSGDGVWQTLGDVGVGPERIDGVLRDREGAVWIRTARRMWLLPRGATRAIDISDGLPSHFDLVGAPSGMALDPRGTVLIGTDMGVAYREGDHWHLIDRSVGMPAAATRSVLVDREGTVWIGAAGLFQMRGRGIIEHYNAASGLPGDIVWTFRRDPHGALWLGTNRCLVRAAARRWQCLPGTEGRTVRSLAFPPQGGMFLGGAPSDLLYIDDAGRMTSFGHDAWPAEAAILSLALGPDGGLWIATKAGLYRLPGARPGPFEHVAIPGVRPEARFAAVVAVGDQIWTATDEGLLVLDRGTWHRFNASAGFPSSVMRRVAARADGRMCVTYNAAIGFSCFRYRDGHVSDIEHIGPAQGLTAGMVYFLGEDRQRRLWIGTGDGVDVLTPQGLDHFDEHAGLAGNDSSATAFFIDDDGSLWLGATGGATHVMAQDYAGPPAPPRTAFLGGRLGDQPIAGRAALDTPHDRNALTLEFAASSLLDTARVEYAVRLSPTESEWSVTHQRQARYPALLPGTYRFEVRARIGAGSWGPATELPFTVQHAWWQTRWFLVGIGLLLAAAIMWRQRFVLVRRTQQLHARSDASFRAVIDLMPDLISVYRDRRLIYLNVAIRRFLGVDGPGDGWDQLELIDSIHPDDRRRAGDVFRRLDAVAAGDSSEVIELRLRGADGSWRTCEVSAIQVDIGGVLTVVASGRDVTERKRMHAKLLVSDRMASLGTLAAGIAHEINNPLAYVAGNLEAMAESLTHAKRAARSADCDELSAVVADARDGAERVRKIVQGLRSFSRSEQREQRIPLALADVLQSAVRLTGNELRHRAQLVRELHPVPRVVADDGRLTQVFINLLVNAAHAIPEGHSDANRIIIRTRTDAAGRAVAEIEDTGQGMPPDVAARVFDPFFTTKNVGEGTGLGLSICHGIISNLGGQIAIDSAPGHGTIVRVTLPAYLDDTAPVPSPDSLLAAPEAPSSTLASSPATAAMPSLMTTSTAVPTPAPISAEASSTTERRHRVMLVDDEPQVAQTMERLLRREFDVTLAGCGRDAINLISGGARFDAIVSDVMMPNMTGIELIEELRRIAPDQAQRLIFLSGGAFTAQTRERLDQLGAPQLEKPITARELRACVKRIATEAV